ncbi:glucose-6-phosphate dehydrogenase [Candidatus Daviesbacteria bacterium]|nr:glucose-6-phosphate dehydrogenase [Candidatus Daviesbacteria bacterium]
MKNLTLVFFGITSNLAQKYFIPALYDMCEKGVLPDNMTILGNARTPMDKAEFASYIHKVLHLPNVHHQHSIQEEFFKKLIRKFHYLAGHLDDPVFYTLLKHTLDHSGLQDRIFYLATYPDLYHHIFENLKKVSLNKQDQGFVRLMIEKPIGHDLKSAKALNTLLLKYFTEDQIYRLDHYLGKETLQNILTFRFSNGIFEPLINKEYIDHIQITASEDFGIGQRGSYYDQLGALKDVGQNHQLQMLAFATMNAPAEFSNEAVTRQRIKILQSLTPVPKKIVFGQYAGYRKEENVDPVSNTDTFYAFKTFIKNDRFKDVPVYIRAGKKLAQTVTEISIIFKNPINRLLKNLDLGEEPNVLIYRVGPNEGIVLKILTKVPGHEIKLEPEYMQFCYKADLHSHIIPDPHERLLMDTIHGDQTFFNDAEEVEAQWAFIDPLANARGKPHIYKVGTWGPKEAGRLIEEDGRSWLEPSMDFCRI